MAPKRKIEQHAGNDQVKAVKTRRTYTPDPAFTRTTRSKTSGTAVPAAAEEEVKSKKKSKMAKKGGATADKGKAIAKSGEEENVKDGEKVNGEEDVVVVVAAAEEEKITGKTVIVEYCKQCNSFKTRALQVKEGLEKAVLGTTVILNPDKPRRGCFEIREDGGETFISLLDMKRPFKPMKDLEMENVISNIIEKIRS